MPSCSVLCRSTPSRRAFSPPSTRASDGEDETEILVRCPPPATPAGDASAEAEALDGDRGGAGCSPMEGDHRAEGGGLLASRRARSDSGGVFAPCLVNGVTCQSQEFCRRCFAWRGGGCARVDEHAASQREDVTSLMRGRSLTNLFLVNHRQISGECTPTQRAATETCEWRVGKTGDGILSGGGMLRSLLKEGADYGNGFKCSSAAPSPAQSRGCPQSSHWVHRSELAE